MKHYRLDSTNQRISLHDKAIGYGADARVYPVLEDTGSLVKLFYPGKVTPDRELKLKRMVSSPPPFTMGQDGNRHYVQLAWPTDLVRDDNGALCGYLMPCIDIESAVMLEALMTDKAARRYGLDTGYHARLYTAYSLAALVARLHQYDIHIVDLKPANILIYRETGQVAFVDCDGLSIRDSEGERWPAHQYSPDYICPEALQQRQPPEVLGQEQDHFALAVIIFRLLNSGIHPFQGRARNPKDLWRNLQNVVAHRWYVYGKIPDRHFAPSPWSIHEYLEDGTRDLFQLAFVDGVSRPTAGDWQLHLKRFIHTGAEHLHQCERNEQHQHFSKGCGFCAVLDKTRGVKGEVQKAIRAVREHVRRRKFSIFRRRKKPATLAVQMNSMIIFGALKILAGLVIFGLLVRFMPIVAGIVAVVVAFLVLLGTGY